MAPFGLKLWENAFQTIPDISFFEVEKHFWQKMFDDFFSETKLSLLEDLPVLTRRNTGVSVLATGHICPGWKTYLSWLEGISVLERGHIGFG